MKIVLAADPFAYELKKTVAQHLTDEGHTVIDADEYKNIPYYDAAVKASEMVASGTGDGGIFFCGTGAGMNIIANKVPGIFAVAVESVFSAQKAKAINKANVITMGAMIVGPAMACEMADAWINTKFTQGLEGLSDFLHQAVKTVADIDSGFRK